MSDTQSLDSQVHCVMETISLTAREFSLVGVPPEKAPGRIRFFIEMLLRNEIPKLYDLAQMLELDQPGDERFPDR